MIRSLSVIICIVIFIYAFELFGSVYYASPSGNSNGTASASPFQIADFWSVARPGDTLILLDGIYTGDNSMILPPMNLHGTSENRIIIKALNDGKAIINGEFSRLPVRLNYNDYFIIQGINAHSSSWGVVVLSKSNNNIVRRVIAWDAYNSSSRNVHVFDCTSGNNNLFEDCAGWGVGRKIFSIINDKNTTFRRCFFRWTYTKRSDWKVGITISYYSENTTIENCIGTWDRLPGSNSSQSYATFGLDHAESSKGTHRFFGNIGYQLAAQNGPPQYVMTAAIFNESQANTLYKDVIGYVDQSVSSDPVYVGSNGSGSNITVGKGTNILLDGQNISMSNLGGNILQYGLDESNRPKVNNISIGAQIAYCYANGELTNQPLWPWPMNERIKQAMRMSGYDLKGGLDGKGGIDLTKTIFELGGGNLPSNFNNEERITASIIADKASGVAPLTVNFQAYGYNGQSPYIFSWTLNEFHISSEQQFEHTFTESGNYNITLTVTDQNGLSASENLVIIVNNPSSVVDSNLDVVFSDININIDGVLTEGLWANAEFTSFSNSSKCDNLVKVRALWNQNYLYFAYEVFDNNLEASNLTIYQDDGAEIYLDINNDKTPFMDSNDYHILININNMVDGPPGITSHTSVHESGYTIEIAIPWSSLSTTPSSGKVIGLLLGNNDKDNGRCVQFDWLNIIKTGSYARPNMWGTIRLLEAQNIPIDLESPSPPKGLKFL